MDFMGGQVVEYGTNASEQALIKRMGGKSHKNSGRGMKKADGSWNNFIIDVKEAGRSFTLNTDVWSKICTDTAKVNIHKDPALIVSFTDTGTKLAVIALDVLERLLAESD
jgi:hypothetical protein